MADRVHVHCSFDSRMSQAGVIAALTDFSTGRLETWPNIDPAKYKVHEVGDTWALVTEGNAEPDIWALERYSWGSDWVSIKAEESNFCCVGDGTDLKITPNTDGGSHIELDWEREAATPDWEPIMAMMAEQGETLLAMAYRDRLDQLADTAA